MVKRAVLLVGFGGPEKREDIRPFLAEVLKNRPVPPGRVEEVVRQYERIGGRSPYNRLAGELGAALEGRLGVPLVLGMRHGSPGLADALRRLKREGVGQVAAVPLSAYRSIPSWNYYLSSTAAALREAGGGLVVRYVKPWHAEPAFAEAMADRVAEAWRGLSRNAACFFTAHSIPIPWDRASGYSRQIADVCDRVARRAGVARWSLAFQSRSGRPEDPWLEPDIGESLGREPGNGRDVLVVPAGFLMDHVEVLFDLDVKAREAAEASGWRFHRAPTVGRHPGFVEMLAGLIRKEFETMTGTAFLPGGMEGGCEAGAEGKPLEPGPTHSAKKDTMNFTRRRVAVVGAGIAGLSAAHRLVELGGDGIELTVLEAADRPGGVVETGRRDGFLWEGGPDSFITEKPAAVALAKRLGMENQILGTNKQFQQSFVAKGDRLFPTPEGFYLLAPSKLGPLFTTPLLSWKGKFRAAMDLVLPPKGEDTDETLASFVLRRFGRETLDRLAQPMVAGIYSADPDQLSLKATFPRFLEMERKYGGVIRALLAARRKKALPAAGTSGPRYGLFAAFERGVQSFLDEMIRRLPEGALRLNAGVSRVERKDRRWRLWAGREEIEADAVVLAVPSPAAGRLLRGVDPALAQRLEQTPYGSMATVNVAARRDRLTHPLDGFGFVAPSIENRTVTGCTFSSVKFPGRAPEGHALLRAFIGGNVLSRTDDEVKAAVVRDLTDYLGLKGDPEWMELRRYPGAMPHYTLGHMERTEDVFRRVRGIEGLALAGNGYTGIGLPDCVASGESAAESVWNAVSRIQPVASIA